MLVGKVRREHRPLTAGPGQIDDRVDHLPQIEGARAAGQPPRRRREELEQHLPLLIGDIGGVDAS
jgi:hypothetical protein